MPRCIYVSKRLLPSLRQLISVRCFFLITCISFAISVFWIQFVDKEYLLEVDESLIEEALENIGRDYRYVNVYRKSDKLPKDIKYILLWTDSAFSPFNFLGSGQRGFIEKNCSFSNCYVTNDRYFFEDGDLSRFDAIGFNGRNIGYMTKSHLPRFRYPHQRYIFFNMESSDNYPVCNEIFDDFFNWTATYKLNSDIPFPYILIKNSEGEKVGPKLDMNWNEDLDEVDEEVLFKLQNKTKAAAWFVSHCYSRSDRKKVVTELTNSLSRYGLTVDVYGKCGPLRCPRSEKASCDTILEKDYYFYLSFENSFSEDYVTEKLLTAVEHYVVPIVYGGANYTRFLPPGSYLDARKYSADDLAETMVALMKSPTDYQRFFTWRNHYMYYDPSEVENVCAFCEALNDEEMMQQSIRYIDFREWWLPKFETRCGV